MYILAEGTVRVEDDKASLPTGRWPVRVVAEPTG